MWQYRNKDRIGFGEAVVKLFVFTFIIRSSGVCHFVCLFVVSLFVCLLFVVCCLLFVCLFVCFHSLSSVSGAAEDFRDEQCNKIGSDCEKPRRSPRQ